jgi:hypothetical protein
MDIKETIIVMNKFTWELLLEATMKDASKKEDPILYMSLFGSLDLAIDESVADNFTEVWDKGTYKKFRKKDDNEDYI